MAFCCCCWLGDIFDVYVTGQFGCFLVQQVNDMNLKAADGAVSVSEETADAGSYVFKKKNNFSLISTVDFAAL